MFCALGLCVCTGVSYPGEASIIPAAAAEKLSTVEQQFEVLLSKATSLKQAIKSADAAAATSILQGADADAVAQQADLPLVWPSTVNNPKQVTLNRQLYNFKDQGDAAMAPSFAAIAALEGALDAANSGAGGEVSGETMTAVHDQYVLISVYLHITRPQAGVVQPVLLPCYDTMSLVTASHLLLFN